MPPYPVLVQQKSIPCSTSLSSQQLFLSASNRFLAVVGDNTVITICSMQNDSEIYRLRSQNVSEVLFSIDDSYLIINCLLSVRSYSLTSKVWNEDIVHYNPSNAITSIIRSNDYSQLLIVNHSQLIVLNSYNNKKIITDLPEGCRGTIIQDQHTGILITSDYDCTICTFSFSKREPIFKKKAKIANCRIGQLSLIGNQALISPGTVMDTFAQFLTVDLQTLEILSRTRFNSSLFPLRATRMRNYPLVYPYEGKTIEIFNGSLQNFLAPVSLKNLAIIDSAYSLQTNRALFLLENLSSQISFVASYSLTYRCPSNTTKNDDSCLCDAGSQFRLSTGHCVKQKCSQAQCPCPKFYSYDYFTLECSLNCSQIFGSTHLPPFDNPQKCYCKPPLIWNRKLNDCSEIDCSYITHSLTQGVDSACTCQEEYKWNSSSYECTRFTAQQPQIEDSSSISVGLIIGGILALALIVILVILFFYKRRRQMTENEKQPYVPYKLRKVLEQLPTHRNLQDDGQEIQLQGIEAKIVESPTKE